MVYSVSLSRISENFRSAKSISRTTGFSTLIGACPWVKALDKAHEEALTDFGLDRDLILPRFLPFFSETFGKAAEVPAGLKTITILGGADKSGNPEIQNWDVSIRRNHQYRRSDGLRKKPSSRISNAWPTAAPHRQTDTDRRPDAFRKRAVRHGETGRPVVSEHEFRHGSLTVREFLEMHAGSRLSRILKRPFRNVSTARQHLAGGKGIHSRHESHAAQRRRSKL